MISKYVTLNDNVFLGLSEQSVTTMTVPLIK
jgi:hypothetical protein